MSGCGLRCTLLRRRRWQPMGNGAPPCCRLLLGVVGLAPVHVPLTCVPALRTGTLHVVSTLPWCWLVPMTGRALDLGIVGYWTAMTVIESLLWLASIGLGCFAAHTLWTN